MVAYLDMRKVSKDTLRRDLRIAFRLSESLITSLLALTAQPPQSKPSDIHFVVPRAIAVHTQAPVGILEVLDTHGGGVWRVAQVCSPASVEPITSSSSSSSSSATTSSSGSSHSPYTSSSKMGNITFSVRYLRDAAHDKDAADESLHLVQDALRIRVASPHS